MNGTERKGDWGKGGRVTREYETVRKASSPGMRMEAS